MRVNKKAIRRRAVEEVKADFCDFCRFYMVEIFIIVVLGTSPAHVLGAVLMDDQPEQPTHANVITVTTVTTRPH